MSPDHTEYLRKLTFKSELLIILQLYLHVSVEWIALLLHTLQMLSTDLDPQASYLVKWFCFSFSREILV